MSWPQPASSSFSSAAVVQRKKDERRAKAHDQAASACANALPFRAIEVSDRTQKYLDALENVLEKLRGAEFRAWYEVTTGKPVEPWLERVAITHEQFISLGHRSGQQTLLDWIEEQVRTVIQRNPWSNPDMKAFWGEQIAACACAVERRALLLKLATPPWASSEKMRAIYLERARMEAETGVPHDVDHIIPIVNQRVCGLHWEGNLRVIPASENRRKSNFFDPNA